MSDEINERFKILKELGLETDLNISKIFFDGGEICFGEKMSVMGMEICLINRLSAKPQYYSIFNQINEQLINFATIFYMMVSEESNRLAFLFASNDKEKWGTERRAMEFGEPFASVVDLVESKVSIEQIILVDEPGGPLF